MGLWPLACCNCAFECRRGHGCLSVVSVVCCQVEVSASGWSLVQRSPRECDREASIMKGTGSLAAFAPLKILIFWHSDALFKSLRPRSAVTSVLQNTVPSTRFDIQKRVYWNYNIILFKGEEFLASAQFFQP